MCKFKHKELVHYLLLSTPLHLLNICKRFRSVAYHCVGTTLGKKLHKPHGSVLALGIYVKTQYILLVLRADDYLVGVADEIHTRCVLVNARRLPLASTSEMALSCWQAPCRIR